MSADKFMVFDVESIGLHGDGFAVAWVVVNREGERLDEGCLACAPAQCAGTDESRLWVAENVPPLEVTSPTPQHLRNTFWHHWRYWADKGAVLVADCAWPVEANFLSACVKLNHSEREWQGPYPLHDLASVLLALGADALAVTERQADELPAHHPLMDSRQSARQLVAGLKRSTQPLKGGARNALGAEVCRLQADAARYRWLAQDDERIGERLRNTLDTWDGCDGKAGFDSAIDAAMRDAPNVAIES